MKNNDPIDIFDLSLSFFGFIIRFFWFFIFQKNQNFKNSKSNRLVFHEPIKLI
jgi:hypothetical protein